MFLTEIVNDYGPQIRDLRATVVAMHPHSPLFRRWLTAEAQTFSLLLQFDNHGKKVDLCQAADGAARQAQHRCGRLSRRSGSTRR